MVGSHLRKLGQLQEKPLLWTISVLWVPQCGWGALCLVTAGCWGLTGDAGGSRGT